MPKKKKDNPGFNLQERMAIVETDIKWLKKGYWIQVGISLGSFISLLALIKYVLEVI